MFVEIEYLSALKKPEDTIDLYKSLEWYQLPGYTDEDIALFKKKAQKERKIYTSEILDIDFF